MPTSIALVVAAGRGHRMGEALPKQYLPLGGAPLLRRSLEAFATHPRIDAVRTVIHPDDRALYDAAVGELSLLEPVAGGALRQDSVANGLESLVEAAPEQVLIHDGVRPFVTAALIDRALDALADAPAAIPALPLTDSLKRATEGRVAESVARDGLWRAQTPQAFRFGDILAAHRAARGQGLSDDAAVAEWAGLTVVLVAGSPDNVKVTTPDDLARAERRLAGSDAAVRIGTGFDAHRFGPGDHVMLCGVKVPHDRGLVGHSDGDVAIHAVVDALLGALGGGDIGSHFPAADPRWAGAESSLFLRHAADLVREAGGEIGNIDVTLICERPRIADRRHEMAARLADILALPVARISVKATTTDGLGFTGRREGIAAQAAATLRLKP